MNKKYTEISNIVIGTAGHVDHGKTTLIKALSGIDTDKTVEEKKRGISINLGFAYFDLPSGKRCGVIDVPGHEKFIKNMLAGVTGMNLILLIIDAKEGIMAQTKEHFEILSLLGIDNYIIVITKIDLVEKQYLELVKEDIELFIKNNNIIDVPIVEVDSISGKGINNLLNIIDKKIKTIDDNSYSNESRLNVDRVFQVKGFGTVVTGTLLEGEIKIGDELEVYPTNDIVKVRNIQVHEKNVSVAYSGQRTAINLQNIKKENLKRGYTLATPNSLSQTYMVDAQVKLIKDIDYKLKLWDRVRFYTGTTEVMARVVPLGLEEINSGETAFIQIRLEEEVSVKKYDKFIIRTYSPMNTIGGGILLDILPEKHKRFEDNILNNLKIQLEKDKKSLIENYLLMSQQNIISKEKIAKDLNLNEYDIYEDINILEKENKIYKLFDKYIHEKKYEEIKNKIIIIVGEYHKKNPLKQGILKLDLISKFKNIKNDLEVILEYMKINSLININNNVISVCDFEVKYTEEQLKYKKEIENQLLNSKFMLPTVKELTKNFNKKIEVLDSLVGNSLFILEDNLVLHEDILKEAKNKVLEYFKKEDKLTLAQFRDITGTSRKYSLPILEYLDKIKLTKRVGDFRVLNNNIIKNRS